MMFALSLQTWNLFLLGEFRNSRLCGEKYCDLSEDLPSVFVHVSPLLHGRTCESFQRENTDLPVKTIAKCTALEQLALHLNP